MSSDKDTNVFNTTQADEGTTTPAQPDVTSTPTPTVPDSAQEFVGEGKKYTSVEAALEAIPHAQTHISNIEAENAVLREQVAKATTIDDVLSQMKATQQPDSTTVQQPVNEDAIATQVLNTIKAQETAQLTASNIKIADDFVKKTYGEKAGEVTRAASEKLGITLAMLEEIAGKSPDAFFKLIADNTNVSSSDVPLHIGSSVNVDAVINHTPADKNKRPENSVLYNSTSADLLAEWNRCKSLVETEGANS